MRHSVHRGRSRGPCGQGQARRSSGEPLLQLRRRERREAQALERAAGRPQVATEHRRAEREQAARDRAGNACPFAYRDEKGEAMLDVLAHVAMLGEGNLLAPVLRIGELLVHAAPVHPFVAIATIVIREREVRRPITDLLPGGDTLAVERVGDAPDRWLRALLVDVPALEM